MRRRVWSAVATMRARDAVSSPCASALAIAVATSSVKSASRASVSGRDGSSPRDSTVIAPHSRPSTVIGAATAAQMPSARMCSGSLAGGSFRSKRAARPVSHRRQREARVRLPALPVRAGPPVACHQRHLAVGLEPHDHREVGVEQRRDLLGHRGEHQLRPIPRATSVATRRRAACSRDPARSSSRASALATAVATSSGRPASRASRPPPAAPASRRRAACERATARPSTRDRGPDRRPDAEVARDLHRGCVVASGIAVHPHGLAGLVDERGHVVPTKWQPGRPLHVAVPVPAPDDHSTAHFVAGDRRPLGVEQAAPSSATEAKTAGRGAPRAPRVATRCSAACSFTQRWPSPAPPGEPLMPARTRGKHGMRRDARPGPGQATAEGETTLLSVSIPRD